MPKHSQSVNSQQWNAMNTPDMLRMLTAKFPVELMDRWNRKFQAIRKRHLHEPDLQDLINFVEDEAVLRNNPLFSRESTSKHPEMFTPMKSRKLKNCYAEPDEKNDMKVEQTETMASTKYKFSDGNHDLDNCQFYHKITVDD